MNNASPPSSLCKHVLIDLWLSHDPGRELTIKQKIYNEGNILETLKIGKNWYLRKEMIFHFQTLSLIECFWWGSVPPLAMSQLSPLVSSTLYTNYLFTNWPFPFMLWEYQEKRFSSNIYLQDLAYYLLHIMNEHTNKRMDLFN